MKLCIWYDLVMTTKKSIRQLRTGRAYLCVDAENLLATPRFTEDNAATLKAELMALIDDWSGDIQVSLATGNCRSAAALRYGFGLGRVSWRRGPDGADFELISVLETDHLAARFECVVIASGDGRFADVAAALAAQGCHVIVIARPDSISMRLRLAASEVRYLWTDPVAKRAIVLPARRRAA